MSVFVLGGAQTDFSRNFAREQLSIGDIMREATEAALSDAHIDGGEVQVAHVGNFVGELFCGQGQLGGVLAEEVPALRAVPTSRHEAACASGSVAVLAAMAEIEAGRYDIALVCGVEQMRNVHGDVAATHLGVAAWAGKEAIDAPYVWPRMFSDLTAEYDRRYGIDYEHLGEIARINYDHARANPNAQTRSWSLTPACFTEDDAANPVVDGWVRRYDCGRVTDGAAVVVLASERVATEWAQDRGLRLADVPRVSGWGHRCARISYDAKVCDSASSEYVFPHLRTAAVDAWRRAGVSLPHLDLFEVHDCFAMTEYMIIDHLGITAPGRSFEAIEDGRICRNGAIPVNPSGGLIGLGHPVGATGVRMLLDCAFQVSGRAGDLQVEGAKCAGTLNIGGSATTVVSFVVETGAP